MLEYISNLLPIHEIYRVDEDQRVIAIANDILIKGFDQRQPVKVVQFCGTSEIFVVDGHHRVAGAKKAGLTQVPVDFVSENTLTGWMTYAELLERSSYSYAGW